jgi:glycine/D-amino acid oxidase-like deaminating enzyme
VKQTEILIIGGGIAGLATAWHLARRGRRDVVLLEREDLLGSHSSGRNAAILRTAGPDPLIVDLASAGADFLRRPPEGFATVPLVNACGLILAGEAGWAAELREWMRHAGPESKGEELAPGQFEQLAPHFADAPAFAVHLAGEGRLDIAAMVDGFARGARRGGTEILTGSTVEHLLVRGSSVLGAALKDGQEIHAAQTVIAAGGWSRRLGEAAGSRVELRPTRRHLLTTAPDPRVNRGWPVVWNLSEEFYCCPESGGLLLSGCDQVDVDADRCAVDPEVREMIARKATRLLPDHADAGEAHFWCSMRTLTRDGRFAVGPDPDLAGLCWVAGLGGHGMVCGPEVGRLAAAVLCGEGSGEGTLKALNPARLAG